MCGTYSASRDSRHTVFGVRTTSSDASGYVRLITNLSSPGELDGSASEELIALEDALLVYADGVLASERCPFMRHTLAKDGYRVRVEDMPVLRPAGERQLSLLRMLGDTVCEFKTISPAATVPGQAPDPTVVIAGFAHPQDATREGAGVCAAFNRRHREQIFRQGLMFEIMHPYHADPQFVSGTPFLTMRRMHEPDRVFMDTVGAKAAYSRIFGA